MIPEVDRPLFIVGAGRSGTTLLRSIFSAHRDISILPETHFMESGARRGLLSGKISDFDEYWRHYTSTVLFADLGVDADRCRRLVEQQGEPTARSVFRAAMWAYGERAGKRRVGEKTPGHLAFLGTLFEWFPDARVILVERDPRAVVASKLKNPWAKRRVAGQDSALTVVRSARRHRIAVHSMEWARAYEHRAAQWWDDPRVLPLKYESLVKAPEETLRAACEFVGEQFDPAMLRGAGDAAPPPAGQVGDSELDRWREEHHARAVSPVNTASLNKWRKTLTRDELAMVEGWCAERMQVAGYSFITSSAERAAGRLAVRGLLAAGKLERKVQPLAKSFSRAGQ